MPTYEYRCPNGHGFERFFRKISDSAAEVPCPECGASALRQMSAGAGLLFKGSGFYLTDYGKNAHRGGDTTAKSGEAAGGGGEPKSDSSSSKSDSSSSETKPAKTESKPSTGQGSSTTSKSDN